MTTNVAKKRGVDYSSPNIATLEAVLYVLGLILILLTPCMPGHSFSESACRLTVPMVISGILAALLIWGGAKIGNRQRSRRWATAFLQENADLNLDLKTVLKVQAHLRQNTGWIWHKTEDILTSVVRSLRFKDPYSPDFQNPWAHEVINAYRFFKDGEGELIPTGCKKK